ncbi:hypothetical protein JCM4814A_79170 [Streptomyces phaeofaciens JCM 4814]|uniref:Uncharacterized protein n=1 Tax=Streptomyces phaeofaciens TaxID=68254 RepID=A0A918M0N3_9ACTN|nr:hypothetical protein [Streptomyces phaeofaciens]GGT92818.1 hypothetical protein GCM10010226_83470 [Streptomyces phaeofaciens]
MGGPVAGLRGGGAVCAGVVGFEVGEFVVPLGALLAQVGQAAQRLGADDGLGPGAGEAVQVVFRTMPVARTARNAARPACRRGREDWVWLAIGASFELVSDSEVRLR